LNLNPKNQITTGKAFEYAILIEFKEKLERKTRVNVIKNNSLEIAKECFKVFDSQEQGQYLLSASFAVNFLIDIEPRLSNGIDKHDTLELKILSDKHGKAGDVRDILTIRKAQEWEIGVSAKNNHDAAKHSRLSDRLDFGDKWLGIACSKEYFSSINPIFLSLRKLRKDSNKTQKWNSLPNKETHVYKPLLLAFKKELLRIYDENPKEITKQLIQYLIGRQDFYKVIKRKNHVQIKAYNLYGTLNLPFQETKPKFQTPKLNFPTEISEIYFKKDKNLIEKLNTLIFEFDKGWKISFRIHNASSRIEPSLKFDIQLVSAPKTLFTNKLSIKHGE